MKTFSIAIGKGKGALKLDAETLLGTRCLIQGKSGSGKSHLVRVIVEQTISQGVQTIVFDPSGEFKTLRERCDLLIAGNQAEGADVPLELRSAKQLLRRVAETGISCVLDLSDLSKKDRREFVRIALDTLHNLPRTHWAPRFIVVDECQEYAPESGKGKSTSLESVIETANQGRKRGHCLIAVTLRLSALSKDVTAELQNKIIGNTDHIDLKRAQDALGSTAEQRETLRKLSPGTYFATGPALSDPDLVLFEGRASQTTHPKPGTQQRLKTPPPSKAVKSRILKEFEALPPSKDAEDAASLAGALARIKELERDLRKAQAGDEERWKNAAKVKKLQDHLASAQTAEPDLSTYVARKDYEALHKAVRRREAALVKRWTSARQILLRLGDTLGAAVEDDLPPLPDVPSTVVSRVTRPRPPSGAASSSGEVARTGTSSRRRTGSTASSGFDRMLHALAQHGQLGKQSWAVLCGISSKTGTFRNYVSRGKVDGLWAWDGRVAKISQAGVDAAGDFEPLPQGSDLLDYWKAHKSIPTQAGNMLEFIASMGDDGATKEQVADFVHINVATGTFRNYISRIRVLGLISGKGTEADPYLAASEIRA